MSAGRADRERARAWAVAQLVHHYSWAVIGAAIRALWLSVRGKQDRALLVLWGACHRVGHRLEDYRRPDARTD